MSPIPSVLRPHLNLRVRLNRWRHSRGFGIHSPFAFRFITEVLCEKRPYHAYARAGADADSRLIVRLVAFFQPATVAVSASGERAAAIRKSVLAADSRVKIVDTGDAADFHIIDPRGISEAQIAKARRHFTTGLILSKNDIAPLGEAMSFVNGRGTTVCVCRRGLPPQCFSVRF